MLIFIVMFFSAIAVITGIVGFIIASSQALMSFAALLVLGCVAIAIGMKNNRAWSWMFIGIIAMVAIETLVPHAAVVVKVLAAVVAGIATVSIKRPMLRYIRTDSMRPANVGGPRLTPVVRTILTFI